MCSPVDRCCCSHCGGPPGTANFCCGPPVWMAARGACITMAIFTLLSMVGAALDLGQDACDMSNAEALNYATVVVCTWCSLMYCWGIWVAQSKNGAMAKALFFAHIIASVLYVGVSFCSAGGFSKNPREKDAVVGAVCYAVCDLDPPRSPFGGDPCEVRSSIPAAVGSLVITSLVQIYFGFVLWSFMTKIQDGTVDNAGNIIVTMAPMATAAAPMAVGYAPQAVGYAPQAAPVQAQAVPVAQAQALDADPNMYPDLNKPPVAQAQAI